MTALFHFGRGAPADGVIFAAVVFALVLCDVLDHRGHRKCRHSGMAPPVRAVRRLSPGHAGAGRWGEVLAARAGAGAERRRNAAVREVAVVVAAATAYGWVVDGWPLHGWPVWMALAVPGLLAAGLAWPQRAPARHRPVPTGTLAWACVAVLAGLWQLAAYVLQQRPTPDRLYDHPTVSLFVDPLLEGQPIRSVGFAVWLAGGYLLLRRGRMAAADGIVRERGRDE